jgi:hypothetical protein
MEDKDQNQNPSASPAQEARSEEKWVALYMELTGASQDLASNVYASLETTDDLDPGWNRAWISSKALSANSPMTAAEAESPINTAPKPSPNPNGDPGALPPNKS